MDGPARFIQGMILGFSIAAPVGPIGVLCIRRTLTGGRLLGLLSGLGAATADACYGMVAAFGFSAAGDFLAGSSSVLRLAGGMFMLYLGYSTFRSRPAEASTARVKADKLSALTSTFALTLTNPMTILSFAAIFAGLGTGEQAAGVFVPLQLVAGVFSGSLLWWLLLAWLVGGLRSRSRQKAVRQTDDGTPPTAFKFGSHDMSFLDHIIRNEGS